MKKRNQWVGQCQTPDVDVVPKKSIKVQMSSHFVQEVLQPLFKRLNTSLDRPKPKYTRPEAKMIYNDICGQPVFRLETRDGSKVLPLLTIHGICTSTFPPVGLAPGDRRPDAVDLFDLSAWSCEEISQTKCIETLSLIMCSSQQGGYKATTRCGVRKQQGDMCAEGGFE